MFVSASRLLSGTALAVLVSLAPAALSGHGARAASAATSTMVVQVQISSGYHFSGTFSRPINAKNTGCAMAKDNKGVLTYGALFNLISLNATSLPPTTQALYIIARPYNSGVTRYSGNGHAYMLLIVKGIAFSDGIFSGAVTKPQSLVVTVASGGLSGSATATHVPSSKPNVSGDIAVHWTCPSLIK